MFLRRAARDLFVSLVLVVACGDDAGPSMVLDTTGTEVGDASSSTGSDNELPTMEAVVDAAAACGAEGAESSSFVATRVGCVRPPPSPCTLPDPPKTYVGTVVACPSTDAASTLQVAVDQTGRYHVETVLALEDGTEQRECYGEGGGEVEVIIDDGRLANRPTLVLSAMGHPCD
jgi:hypothetical protein